MAKRVVLTSFGSFGDVHPFIATGLALKAHGLDALIAASADYREKVERSGLEFRQVGPAIDRVMADTGLDAEGLVLQVARNPALVLLEKAIMPYVEQTLEELSDAVRGADLVVTSSFSIVARLVIAKLRLPSVSLLLQPCVFFSAEQPPSMMEAPWLPALRNALGPWAVRALMDLGRARWSWSTRRLGDLRRRLGLPPVRGDEVLAGALQADWIAAPYSPVLGPLPPEAPRNAEIVGFAFYDSEGGETPSLPPPLAAFLADGPAPLVFTLGSWVVHAAGDFYECAAEATGRLGMRAVLLVGRGAEARFGRLASKDVFVAGYAPHSLVFPRAAAIIHHGGIGTVGQALRAGRPQLICPVLGDQLDNAERLVRLGVARRLNHGRFNVDRAAAALSALLADGSAQDRAVRIGAQVATEDGAAVVADRIARMIAA